jgi:putative phosphoesterase
MRLAVLADIHGNLAALEAVIADLAQRAPDEVVNLGDCVSGPLWPAETCERLMALNWPTVRGNHDRWLAAMSPDVMGPSDRFARERLGDDHLLWLGALPATLRLAPDILLCHGTPESDLAYLLDRVGDGRLLPAALEVVAERLGGSRTDLILCGHSHQPRAVRLPEEAGNGLVLNPGSVGCPAYADPDADEPHVSETGSPQARYALLSLPDAGGSGEIGVEWIALDYDHASAARRARVSGRTDWEHALNSGRMPT